MMDPYPARKLGGHHERRPSHGNKEFGVSLLWDLDLGRRPFFILPGPISKEPRLQNIEAHVDNESANEAPPECRLMVSSEAAEVEFH